MKSNNSSNPNHAGISEYSMIIDRSELEYWEEKGWVEKEFERLEERTYSGAYPPTNSGRIRSA